jgi:ABC-2 type transport system permease protein
MNKIWLIISREFKTRVRKKTFIVLTLVAPIFMAAVFVLPAYLASLPGDDKIITVLDEPMLLDFEKGKNEIRFRYLPPREFDQASALAYSRDKGDYAFIHIPVSAGGDPDFLARNVRIFRDGDVSLNVENYVEDLLESYIQKEKLKASGVDPEVIARTKTKVDLRVINSDAGVETENASLVKMGVGYVAALLIYIFIFFYGAQVMRGVIEEKTNRIVEIMISSVKPFQLMLGKIIGVGAVALLQFVIWILFGGALYLLAANFFFAEALEAQALNQATEVPAVFEIMNTLSTINFPLILVSFSFYFIFGYLLYSALFAAIGSAVDKESDSGQFMFPVSLPLIAGIVVIIRALDNPDGGLAFWFSMIPLTSPLVMMARIPFGLPGWELLLSMAILVITFLLFTAGAAKIYRMGILLYGKKPSFLQLFKWIGLK